MLLLESMPQGNADEGVESINGARWTFGNIVIWERRKTWKEEYSLSSGRRNSDYCLWIQLWANKDNNTYLEAGCNLPQANQVQKKGQRRTKNKKRRSGLRRARTFTAAVVDEDRDWNVQDMFFKGHRNMLQLSNLFLARFMFKFVNYRITFQYTTL